MSKNNHTIFKDPRRTAVTLLILIAIIMTISLVININRDKGSKYPSLKFLVSGEVIEVIDLKDMKENLKVHKINFVDPQYKKNKSYEGFSLRDVLQMGFGDDWNSSVYTDIAFEALDGYTSVSTIAKVSEPGPYIVFKDLQYKDWELVGVEGAYPGPFYLVWTGKDQTSANEYPWPWQLSSLDLIKFEEQYSSVTPIGVSANSDIYKGYEIFKARCIRCHSMNEEGGKIGPDLNAPQSIVTYRNAYMIKEFIRHPSKYRFGQMPDNPGLSEQNLDDLISYFKYMDEIRN